MPFTIPNDADAAFGPNSPLASPDSVDFSVIAAGAAHLNAVVSGGVCSPNGGMGVAVTACHALVNGVYVSSSGTTVTIGTAHASLPRFDLVVINGSGTVSVQAGTAASTPAFPAVSMSTYTVLAAVYVPANDTTIDANQIVDKRVMHRADQDVATKVTRLATDWENTQATQRLVMSDSFVARQTDPRITVDVCAGHNGISHALVELLVKRNSNALWTETVQGQTTDTLRLQVGAIAAGEFGRGDTSRTFDLGAEFTAAGQTLAIGDTVYWELRCGVVGYSNAVPFEDNLEADVHAATTANIATLAGGAPNTLDGVTLVAGDHVLVKNQTTQAANGVYVVTTLGTGSNGTWTRVTTLNTGDELSRARVYVQAGTTNGAKSFRVSEVDNTTWTEVTAGVHLMHVLANNFKAYVADGENGRVIPVWLGRELHDYVDTTAGVDDTPSVPFTFGLPLSMMDDRAARYLYVTDLFVPGMHVIDTDVDRVVATVAPLASDTPAGISEPYETGATVYMFVAGTGNMRAFHTVESGGTLQWVWAQIAAYPAPADSTWQGQDAVLSPSGTRVAVTIKKSGSPVRVVVYNTGTWTVAYNDVISSAENNPSMEPVRPAWQSDDLLWVGVRGSSTANHSIYRINVATATIDLASVLTVANALGVDGPTVIDIAPGSNLMFAVGKGVSGVTFAYWVLTPQGTAPVRYDSFTHLTSRGDWLELSSDEYIYIVDTLRNRVVVLQGGSTTIRAAQTAFWGEYAEVSVQGGT
jgi:hypothetical protein